MNRINSPPMALPTIVLDDSAIEAFTNTDLEVPRLAVDLDQLGFLDLYVVPAQVGWHWDRVDLTALLGLFAPTGRCEAGANDNIGDSMNNVGRFALFGASALVISCAAGSQPSYTQYGSTRYVIKGAELAARDIAGMTAYDAIRRMRPSWLMDRRVSDSPGDNRRALTVFIDSVLAGGVEVLEYRTFGHIYELRYHIAPEATKRWGYRYAGGAIEVITKKKTP